MDKFLDKNGLLYLWQKITAKFVEKEIGKGLSTNDLTNELLQKLNGVEEGANKYTLPQATAEILGGIKVGAGLTINPDTGVLSTTGGGVADSVDWSGVQSKPTTVKGYGITDAYTKSEIDAFLDGINWADIQGKPETFPPATHNHDSSYLKLSGGKMTGPIEFSADQGQIAKATEEAEAKVLLEPSATEIIFTDKTSQKTNRVTVSKSGVIMTAGETTPGDGTGTQISIDATNGVKIPMVADPKSERDAANKKYVDEQIAAIPETDLSGYYTKKEIDDKGYLTEHQDITGKADKTYVDTELGKKADKTYVDTELAKKANSADVYTKNEVDGKVNVKANSADVYKKTETYNKTEIDGKISSTYKPAGSVAFAGLPATPAAAQSGFVYNVTDEFTTDARFVEGAGKKYPIGTNVVVVAVAGEPTTYKLDTLAGFVDLSPYMKTTDMAAISNEEIDALLNT